MTEALLDLSANDLLQIAGALRAGRLAPPFTDLSLQRYVASGTAPEIASAVQQLNEQGLGPNNIALLFEAIARDRQRRPTPEDLIELVSTGPEAPGVPYRDTRIVVREMFSSARESVTIVGYAVFQGRQVFQALAERMEQIPDLQVRMFLDVQRPTADTSMASEILHRFADRFRTREWPGSRLPEVYYDPRSLDVETSRRSSLHAKCIVVDARCAFISSANFTEAAQLRNIEIGVVIRIQAFAERLVHHFAALAEQGLLRRVPGL